jgi:hypothetical protein
MDQTAPVHAHEEVISVFRREQNEMTYIIAKETGNDTEVVANMLRKSKIMMSDEALEFNLAHTHVGTLPLHQQEKLGFQLNVPKSERSAPEKRERVTAKKRQAK